MPRYRRKYGEGGTFAFTVCLADRKQTTLTDHLDALRSAFRLTFQRYPVQIDAMCVLPDHLHTVWMLPDGDTNYPLRWQLIKKRFNKALGHNPWQPRYWEHTIRDHKDHANHINYVHQNPVKHGLVPTMDDWPYSSWHRWKEAYGQSWAPSTTAMRE
ncbi:MAG: transposase [Parvularculaceae bacterium]|nr:transposase [Parvularculaceae bacterium]